MSTISDTRSNSSATPDWPPSPRLERSASRSSSSGCGETGSGGSGPPGGCRRTSNGDMEIPGGVIATQNISTVIKPNPKTNALQFVKISPKNIDLDQIKLAEDLNKSKEKIKEVETEWQSHLMSWRTRRRQNCNRGDGDEDSMDEQAAPKKGVKTFSEMLKEKARSGASIGLLERYVTNEDEDNDYLVSSRSSRQNQTNNNNENDILTERENNERNTQRTTSAAAVQDDGYSTEITTTVDGDRESNSTSGDLHKSSFNGCSTTTTSMDTRQGAKPTTVINIRQDSQGELIHDDEDDEDDENNDEEEEEDRRQQEEQLINFRRKLSAFENLSKEERSTSSRSSSSDLTSSAQPPHQHHHHPGRHNQKSSSAKRSSSRSSPNESKTVTNNHHKQAANGRSISASRAPPPSSSGRGHSNHQIGAVASSLSGHTSQSSLSSNTSNTQPPSQQMAASYSTSSLVPPPQQQQQHHHHPGRGPGHGHGPHFMINSTTNIAIKSASNISTAAPVPQQPNRFVTSRQLSNSGILNQTLHQQQQPLYENLITHQMDKLHVMDSNDYISAKSRPYMNQNWNPPGSTAVARVTSVAAAPAAGTQLQTGPGGPNSFTANVNISQKQSLVIRAQPHAQVGSVGSSPHHSHHHHHHQQQQQPHTAGYNRNHWLVQEAEFRRQLDASQQARNNHGSSVMTSSNPHLHSSQQHHHNPNLSLSPTSPLSPPPPAPSGPPIVPHVQQAVNSGSISGTTNNSNGGGPMLSVSGRKRCSSCGEELGRGCAAMVIETLKLYYHINCFRCVVCHIQLGNGTCGTDVRVRNQKIHCPHCYSDEDVKCSRV